MAQGQAQRPDCEDDNRQDAERHRDRKQAPRHHPVPPMERPVNLEASPHKRDDHNELGEAFGDLRIQHRQRLQGKLG